MPLSVGTRWTLRYSLAMLVTVVVLAGIVLDRIERRIQQDAELLLDVQVLEVGDALARYRAQPEAFERWLSDKVRAAGPIMGLGVALVGPDGEQRVAAGDLAQSPLPVTPDLLAAVRNGGFIEAYLGRSYPHFVTGVEVEEGLIQVAIYSRPFARRTIHFFRVFQIAIPTMLVLTVGFGWWLTRRSLEPIAEITEAARRITASHLEEWIPTANTGDELDRLAETLNGMMARIREGIERSREFQTRLARELRAPLLALQRDIAALTDDQGLSEFGRRRLHRALEDAEVLAEAIHAMLRLAWSDAGRVPSASMPVPLSTLVEAAAFNVGPAAQRRGVSLGLGPLVAVSVSGDPFWLHQLVDSLMEATVAMTPRGGSVSVWAEKVENASCLVTLRGTPPRGAPPPASRDKEEMGGPASAARLALAREIARAHGGGLEEKLGDLGEVEYRLQLPV